MAVKKSTYRNGKDVLEELLAMETWDTDIKGNRAKMTIGELLHVKMVKKALDGDLKAYAEVLDRVEGKAVQKVEESVDLKFVSRPLGELISFVKPTKTLDETTSEIIELKESADGVFKLDSDFQISDSESGGEDVVD